MIFSHEVLLEIVVRNLLENACKHAGASVHIRFTADEDGFVIQDDGVGIAGAHIDAIFERFWQLEKVEQHGHSFGLGLYLVKKIVVLHGWTIAVESKVGKGSLFRISFTS